MLLVGVVAAVFVIVLLLGVVVLYKFRTFKKGPRFDGRGETIPNPAFEKGCFKRGFILKPSSTCRSAPPQQHDITVASQRHHSGIPVVLMLQHHSFRCWEHL